tara:strand:+ start:1144 stop:1578 length:435 start_codon:yes stop_codon:yes gene_type:complete
MPHQCTKCGKVYPDASEEILTGCECGARFFYYIRQEKMNKLEENKSDEIHTTIKELDKADKVQIEKDIREITGIEEEDKPVILDLESVKVINPGKFEIDIVNLFNKKRPLIYKLEEGKYIIDLAATLKANTEEIERKIRDPDKL